MGRGSQGGARFALGIRVDRSFRSRPRLGSYGSRVCGDAGVRSFLDANQTLIRNFPAEVAVLAALLEILFKENGAAGISDENPGSGQKNIASAILHFHPTTEKG